MFVFVILFVVNFSKFFTSNARAGLIFLIVFKFFMFFNFFFDMMISVS